MERVGNDYFISLYIFTIYCDKVGGITATKMAVFNAKYKY